MSVSPSIILGLGRILRLSLTSLISSFIIEELESNKKRDIYFIIEEEESKKKRDIGDLLSRCRVRTGRETTIV